MRIVVLGAGQVGGTLAENLAFEDNDITLVDTDSARLNDLQHKLDIKTVTGSAAHPNILIEAGIEQADMLIAVTNSDEVNMMGCQIAYSLFKTPNKIARIRSQNFYKYPELFTDNHIPVDVCISPEQLVTEHIVNLVEYPGTSLVLSFSLGKVLLVSIKIDENGPMANKTVAEMNQILFAIEAGIVGILREQTVIIAKEELIITDTDEVLLIASPEAIQQVLIAFGRYTHPNRRIIIAGGGHIGSRLAQTLESRYRIKIIERNTERTAYLASKLNKATVLQGDIADRDLLVNENIEFTDVFCAVTNDDEANIMSCLQAKKLGSRHVFALVNRNTYVDLIQDSNIDHAISPQLITIGSILAKLRRGSMVKIHRLHQDAEAIELIIHGDEQTSKVIGRKIDEIKLPPSTFIMAVVRNEQVFIAEKELTLQAEDHLIILLMQKRYIRQVESLFQVSLSFVI